MFRLELSDVDVLKNSLPTIGEIIDEGVFRVGKDGINLLCPDRTMVAVVDFRLLPTAFDEYSVEKETELGVNMANFVAILKRVKSPSKMILEKGELNKLKITVTGGGTRVFELPLLNVKTEKPPIDQLQFAGKVELDTETFEEGIADADVVGDSVVMEATGDGFLMKAKGDVSTTELAMKKGDKGLLGVRATGTVKGRYALEYLKKMVKAGKLSKQMVLEFSTDYPLRIGFTALDKASLQFILAPRVEE